MELKYIITIFLTVIVSVNLMAEKRGAGEIIVMLNDNVRSENISQFEANFAQFNLRQKQVLSQRFNTYLYSFDQSRIYDDLLLEQIRKDSNVKLAQFNYYHELYEFIPDDEYFSQQWYHQNTGQDISGSGIGSLDADIKSTLAWEKVFNLSNTNKREIVIAVIDNGFDLEHPEINWWKNKMEIPDNGIDDDGNGYIDDYHGWNTLTTPHSGEIWSEKHGTHVSGIIGGIGNNGIGVAGVNWDVKVMPVISIPGYASQVIVAINYAIENRIRYNESGGKEGAYIVASNSSFGASFVNPVRSPVQGEMYNQMGKVGILSAIASGNNNINIDTEGNMPVAYPSPFTIGVASTTNTDGLSDFSAFGKKGVHLGAPGSDIISTFPLSNNGYGYLSGTSMATPMVSGVIGLMFKAIKEDVLAYFDSKPELLPLVFKQLLLQGVDKKNELENKTVSGGRLNSFNAVVLALEHSPKNITALPMISPTTNIFFEPILVTIISETPDAEIRYTMDDTEPKESSLLYTQPLLIESKVRLQARAFAKGHEPSFINTAIYEFIPNHRYVYPPSNVQTNLKGHDAVISWGQAGVNLSHTMYPTTDNSFGSDNAVEFTVAQRFTNRDFIQYDYNNEVFHSIAGARLSEVSFSSFDDQANFTVKIWIGGQFDPLEPGELVHSQNVGSVPANHICTVVLNKPVYIQSNKELWIGYTVSTPGGYPAGVDEYYYVNDGLANLIHWNGKWTTLKQLDLSRDDSWYITGLATIPEGQIALNTTGMLTRLKKIEVFKDDKRILMQVHKEKKEQQKIYLRNDKNANLIGYHVYRQKLNPSQPWIKLTTTLNNEFIFTDFNPKYDDYLYRVEAVYDDNTVLSDFNYFFRYNLPIVNFPWDCYFENTLEYYNGWHDSAIRAVFDHIENGDNWNIAQPEEGFSTGYHIESIFRDSRPNLKNSWQLSPKFLFPNIDSEKSITLKYLERKGNISGPDANYTFMVSLIGDDPFKFFDLFNQTVSQTTWSEKKVDLSEFAGKEVRFAFVHHLDLENPSVIKLDSFSITVSNISDKDIVEEIKPMGLIGNYPNPFNPITTIKFSINNPVTFEGGRGDGSTKVSIEIFNIKGQKIRTLVNGYYIAGLHSVVWDAQDDNGVKVGSGVFLYKLTTDNMSDVKKMVLIK